MLVDARRGEIKRNRQHTVPTLLGLFHPAAPVEARRRSFHRRRSRRSLAVVVASNLSRHWLSRHDHPPRGLPRANGLGHLLSGFQMKKMAGIPMMAIASCIFDSVLIEPATNFNESAESGPRKGEQQSSQSNAQRAIKAALECMCNERNIQAALEVVALANHNRGRPDAAAKPEKPTPSGRPPCRR